ncbi:hypothetical protein AYO21_01959 [Fonsecaea monophora]|uniref:Uncharacterized protein n=1 Tax=Fonsecaea monophora TaxID=254056 RepID=A0A177FK28_9EURO|nr:hypothetical protein AYO21_01959 [Fonsecaea monophora]OAG43732.1 hypothetical protein AYO21_01959 [Fonsecaea monophora]
MFQDPDEIAAEQPAAKLDQLAAAGRSSIRRESTVRPGRIAASRRAALERVREEIGERRRRRREFAEVAQHYSAQAAQREREQLQAAQELRADAEVEAEAEAVEAQRVRFARLRQRMQMRDLERMLASRANPESEPRSDTDVAPVSRTRVESSGTPLDDIASDFIFGALVSESQETPTQPLPPPLRESGLRFELGVVSQPESEPSWYNIPSNARPTRVVSPSGSRRPLWSYSVHRPTFAGLEDEENENGYRATSQPRAAVPAVGEIVLPTLATGRQRSAFPHSQDSDHISHRPQGESTSRLDGLGDRLRSPSPISDDPVEENWGNLLDTMETGRSSTATSFLSSRSNSRSGSHQSSQATTATTSFGEIGGDDSCDLDLPSGITEEDVREIRARHGRLRRNPFTRLGVPETRNSLLSDSSNQHDSSRMSDRVVELEVLGFILNRMQRREEIPDELWAAVGLSPDIVRGSSFDLARHYA